jgi:hypothetical protein
LIASGREPTRLQMRRVMGNLAKGESNLQQGKPFVIPTA